MNTKIIKFDINKNLYNTLIAKQGDTKSRFLLFNLLDGSIPFSLENRSVRVYAVKPDRTEVFNDLIITDAAKGYCILELTTQILAVAGTVKLELMVIEEDKKLTSSIFYMDVKASINSEKAVVSTNEFGALLTALSSLNEYDNYKKEIAAARDGEANLLTKVKKIDEQLDNNTNKIDELNNLKADKDNVKNIYYDGENSLVESNELDSITFRRKHSMNLMKNLKYNMAKMSFNRNFIGVEFSDLYPNLELTKVQTESVINASYNVSNKTNTRGQIRRLFGGFNIFSTYEIEAKEINGGIYGCRTGFSFSFPSLEINIFLGFKSENKIDIMSETFRNGLSQGIVNHKEITHEYTTAGIKFCITNFNSYFELYIFNNQRYEFVQKIEFESINSLDKALNGKVALYCRQDENESITFTNVENYYDCGLTQGDIKLIRYRNGLPIIKDNKLFFSVSARFNEHSYQIVLSKNVSGNEYKIEGILLFEYDKTINSDIASSIIYDNEKGRFIIWNTAFSQNHILGYGECYSDILYGVNIISMKVMKKENINENKPSLSDDTLFLAKYGDEDPDIIFNEKTNKWNLIICRTDSVLNNNLYNYFLFESDNPFTNYTFLGKTDIGDVTGGTLTKVGGDYYIIFGCNSSAISEYRYCLLNNLKNTNKLKYDYGDGGFRGWGTVFPLQCGSYTKYGWITFDRAVVSNYNWSYGNLYYFESNLLNLGNEFNIKYSY